MTQLTSKYISIATVSSIVIMGLIVFGAQQIGLFDIEALRVFVEGWGVLGPYIYGIAYVVLGMLGLSKVAMTVFAGVVFDFYVAMVVTVVAATIAAVLGFLITRRYRRTIMNKLINARGARFRRKITDVIDKIETNADERGFYYTAIMRLSLVPLMTISYAAGLVKQLRLRDFLWAILPTNIYVNFVYIFVGASLVESLPVFMLAVLVLVISMQAPKIINKFSNN